MEFAIEELEDVSPKHPIYSCGIKLGELPY